MSENCPRTASQCANRTETVNRSSGDRLFRLLQQRKEEDLEIKCTGTVPGFESSLSTNSSL
jgi:hypothetical protein